MSESIAILAPEYFPRSDYLAVVDESDRAILADRAQYRRQTFMNRARIRQPEGTMWLTVPVSRPSFGTPVGDVRIHDVEPWARQHWRAMRYNYGRSPYFEHYGTEIEALLSAEFQSLADLAVASTRLLARLLGLQTEIVRESDIGVERPCKTRVGRGVRAVVPASSGHLTWMRDAEEVFEVRYEEAPYLQAFDGFEPGLSALDLLFNWGPQALSMLRERRVVRTVDQADVKLRVRGRVC